MTVLKPLLTILTLSLLSSPSWSETKYDLVYRNGLFYKKFSSTPFTGKISGESFGTFKNGERIGVLEDYHENGQLHISKTFKNGNEQGLWVGNHDNGLLWGKGHLKQGLEVGFWEFFHKNGNPEKRGNYKDGKEEGLWEYFNEDGTFDRTKTFKNGVKVK